MGAYLDAAVGSLVAALQARAMWSSTLFVFHSDNGGEIMGSGICGGNNWPLTGGKFSNWEGGGRVNAFVSGGALTVGTERDPFRQRAVITLHGSPISKEIRARRAARTRAARRPRR